MQFTFTAPLWLYSGKGTWHFVTLPKRAAAEIKFFNASAKGFMPIPVTAKINETVWNTSIFPDSKSGSYILPIKATIRKAERINLDDHIKIILSVRSDI